MTDLSLAQDPDELFDVVTVEGRPTGVAKRRADVHRDGDWHRSVHIWVVGIDERGPFLTFQRRSFAKDTHPGLLDSTVSGHYRSGETLAEALREAEEEIGVVVARAQLTFAGTRFAVTETDSGIRDRELQDVFLLRDDCPLTAYRPNPAELESLIRVALSDALALFAGYVDSVEAHAIAPGATEVTPVSPTLADFIFGIDRYFYRVAVATERFLAGERHIAV